ncbi:MAG: hypothetical protein K2M80_00185 [Muribaculaceae bacterium]|nr:hypothetical protein [Muribaculaceae bacterium]
MATRYDINGSAIGDGTWHVDYTIFDFGTLPISARVEEAISSESVYVTYIRDDSHEYVKVRFSNHTCNDIRFCEVIDGRWSDARELVLVKLGFMRIVKTPRYAKHIAFNAASLKKIKSGAIEMLPMTYSDLYDSVNIGDSLESYAGKAVNKDGKPVVITSAVVAEKEIAPIIAYEMI